MQTTSLDVLVHLTLWVCGAEGITVPWGVMATVSESQTANFHPLGVFAFAIFCIAFFLLPVLFFPGGIVPMLTIKGAVWYFGVVCAAIVACIAVLRRGIITLPWHWAVVSLGVLPAMYLIAGIFSDAPRASLLGALGSPDTALAVCVGVLTVCVSIAVIRLKKHVVLLYGTMFLSWLVAVLLQGMQLIGVGGGIVGMPIGIAGGWTDTAVFFGLSATLALGFLVLWRSENILRVLAGTVVFISIAFLLIADVRGAWYLLGAFAVFLLLYRLTASTQRQVSVAAVVVVIVTMVVLLGGSTVHLGIERLIGSTPFDVRPSWQGTVSVAAHTLHDVPLVGAGPSQFDTQWMRYKPDGVNGTPFWGIVFGQGVSFIPTALVTTGALGLAAWLFFFGGLVAVGGKLLLQTKDSRHGRKRTIAIISFLGTVYLWAAALLYPVNSVLIAYAFLFTGVVYVLAIQEKALPVKNIRAADRPIQNTVFTLCCIGVIGLLLVGVYGITVRFTSAMLLGQGINTFQTRGVGSAAEQRIGRALQLAPSDEGYRTLVYVQQVELARLIVQEGEVSEDVLRNRFQTVLGAMVNNAEQAVAYRPSDYRNWIVLGGVYAQLAPLGVQGALETASSLYAEAQRLNPNGPDVAVHFARLYSAGGDMVTAREHIHRALALKPDYTEAIFLLAQIEVAEGNSAGAIASVEMAAAQSPNNPVLFFQLGLLRYHDGQYGGAASALETAVTLNPIYANARYFLGLAYHELGRRTEAIEQFEVVHDLNPNSEEVDRILSNLRSERAPFDGAAPPLDTPPETRDALPVAEPVQKQEVAETS